MSRYRVVVLLILAGTLAIQTSRLRSVASELSESRRTMASLSRTTSVYKENILRQVRARLEKSQRKLFDIGQASTIVMIVDTMCAACRVAAVALRDISPSRTLYVASFHDSTGALRNWMRGTGTVMQFLEAETAASLLADLPHSATPLFVEFERGDPVDVHLGQPKPSWLQGSDLQRP